MTTPMIDRERIKRLRIDRGARAEEVARRAGLSTAQVYRLENGERPNAAAVTLARVAQVLETSIEYLMGMTDDDCDPGALSPDVKAFAAEVMRIEDDNIRSQAIDLLKEFFGYIDDVYHVLPKE